MTMRESILYTLAVIAAIVGVTALTILLKRRKVKMEAAAQHKWDDLVFGFQEEWHDFGRRNDQLLERFPNIQKAAELAFLGTKHFSEPIDRFVITMGKVCWEDFSEIMVCCGNGYGVAGTKLIRGLYERAVTLRYLHEHPDELDNFWDFHNVTQRRLMLAANETVGEDTFSAETVTDLEARYQAVKSRFEIKCCKHPQCDLKKPNHTWSKLDMVAMAKATPLGKLIVPGYYVPLRQAHATVASMLARLEDSPGGGLAFVARAQRKEADTAVRVALNILIEVFQVQYDRFKDPQLQQQIHACVKDFMGIYSKSSASSGSPVNEGD
jgi:hypothetical protein